MGGYLGYDPCALAILLGALDTALGERLHSRALATPRARRAADEATTVHRRQLAELAGLAQAVGVVLRADPLGAYRTVQLDPRDLDLWALHRGGRWRTANDPTPPAAGWDRQQDALNARLMAGWLTPERWRELLEGDGEAVDPVLRYLDHLAADPVARSIFLDAIGPEVFGALLATASARFTSTHLPGAADQPVAGRARQAIDAFGTLWAAARSQGERRTDAWDTAALGGPLLAASRLLLIGAGMAGALTTKELARWGTAQWRRLTSSSPSELPHPQLVGDQVLGALTVDGRAGRRFLLELGAGPDLSDLTALLSNTSSSPPTSGALLLASTDPSTVRTAADRDEVRRSVHGVLTVVDHLLGEREARAPAPDSEGRLTGRPGATLPAGLGLYTGRQLVHLVDRCDGAGSSCQEDGSAMARLGGPGGGPPARPAGGRRSHGRRAPGGGAGDVVQAGRRHRSPGAGCRRRRPAGDVRGRRPRWHRGRPGLGPQPHRPRAIPGAGRRARSRHRRGHRRPGPDPPGRGSGVGSGVGRQRRRGTREPGRAGAVVPAARVRRGRPGQDRGRPGPHDRAPEGGDRSDGGRTIPWPACAAIASRHRSGSGRG